ncbi:hypothetical protein MKW94_008881 [Papaver nudicaule]|uniref:Cyclin N-terminal domain-containing protein n=1 Tax=Papaver nudicaule TaxID=74823 RepID=A0AA41V283_PAPNU|nr:hypothetical protein [Papaver nudicaule]
MGSRVIVNHQKRDAATKQRITAPGGTNRRKSLGDTGNHATVRRVGAVQGKPPRAPVFAAQNKVAAVKCSKPGNVRNKAGCGVPKESIVDIDRADVENPLAVTEYVEDICKFYKLAENTSGQLHGRYMDLQFEITEYMRMVIVDWLIDIHLDFQLTPEVLYLAVQNFDRYLAMNLVVRKEEIQLIGITALFIAGKYEEVEAPRVDQFAETYSTEQILAMEKSILVKFRWTLPFPNTYHFLVRFTKAALADKEMENMVFFLAELGIMQYATLKYCPSMLAASAVYAAQCTLKRTPLWSETLKLHTGYSEAQLIDCAKILVSFRTADQQLQAVFRKYSSCAQKLYLHQRMSS